MAEGSLTEREAAAEAEFERLLLLRGWVDGRFFRKLQGRPEFACLSPAKTAAIGRRVIRRLAGEQVAGERTRADLKRRELEDIKELRKGPLSFQCGTGGGRRIIRESKTQS